MAPDLKSIFDLPQYWELLKIRNSRKGADCWVACRLGGRRDFEHEDGQLRVGRVVQLLPAWLDSALAASIAGAYEKGEPWVGYYWTPTWVMGKYDMTLLEDLILGGKWQDGFQCAFPSSEITIAVHKDLPERAPEVAEFLSRYKTNSALISEVLSYMTENDTDAQQAAIYFLKEYENIWSDWVSEDVAEKVKAALP